MIEHIASLIGDHVSVEELKHKPGRRRTLRATGSRRAAIVKLYESDRAPIVAARITALAAGPQEPVVPSVLHLDVDRRLLVLSEVDGAPFRDSILAGDTDACRRVGHALAFWHDAWRGTKHDGFNQHGFDEEERILLAQADGAEPAIAWAVRAALPALRGAWDCPTVVHRDLYEEQIVLGDQVGLIDLDDAALGPPELDIGNLLAHIELLALRSGTAVDAAVDALLAGYGADALDAALLDRCRRLALLRLACIHGVAELVDSATREELPA